MLRLSETMLETRQQKGKFWVRAKFAFLPKSKHFSQEFLFKNADFLDCGKLIVT
jgi:hypothetical protein